jgi:hypothetical protein
VHDLGIPIGIRTVMFSQPLTEDGAVLIEVVRFSGRGNSAIRIRRATVGDANTPAALLPIELFLPFSAISAEASGGQTLVVTTRDGYPLSDGGVSRLNPANDKDRFVVTIQSQR